jgi:hypothetical protein
VLTVVGCPAKPPATSTFPFGSSVAVCAQRGALIAPVVDQTPVLGS